MGKGPGERKAAGIYTYTKRKDQIQKNHNKEALALLETKKSQMVIDQQSVGTPFIPTHRFKNNFLDYYAEFVEENKSLSRFKDGYFRIHPAGDIQSKTNASKKLKEFLEAEEYLQLIQQPMYNH